MIVIHLITNSFPPTEGGLEKRLKRLSNNLAKKGYSIFVYICSPDEDLSKYAFDIEPSIKIKLIGSYRKLLEEPINLSNIDETSKLMERYRTDTLILYNLIKQEINIHTNNNHIIFSNYITKCGFIASNVASQLNIPHLASVVGTDFSRGYNNPYEKIIINDVIINAKCIVALNYTFAKIIQNNFKEKNLKVIHSSVSNLFKNKMHKRKNQSQIILFSDCGYCHKKGTQLLIWAYIEILKTGINAKLIICGKTNNKEKEYWTLFRKKNQEKLLDNVIFLDYLDESNLVKKIIDCDIYCYPTLSEGCSNSRISALCLGVPMVTTLCGEIADLAPNVSHIKTCPPGDHIGYKNLLLNTCIELLDSQVIVDRKKVLEWRQYFDQDRETNNWIEAFNSILNND